MARSFPHDGMRVRHGGVGCPARGSGQAVARVKLSGGIAGERLRTDEVRIGQACARFELEARVHGRLQLGLKAVRTGRARIDDRAEYGGRYQLLQV